MDQKLIQKTPCDFSLEKSQKSFSFCKGLLTLTPLKNKDYPLKIDGWKMSHFLLKERVPFQGRHSFIFGGEKRWETVRNQNLRHLTSLIPQLFPENCGCMLREWFSVDLVSKATWDPILKFTESSHLSWLLQDPPPPNKKKHTHTQQAVENRNPKNCTIQKTKKIGRQKNCTHRHLVGLLPPFSPYLGSIAVGTNPQHQLGFWQIQRCQNPTCNLDQSSWWMPRNGFLHVKLDTFSS